MLNQKYIMAKEKTRSIREPLDDLLWMQDQLIEETETLVRNCFDPAFADQVNFDAFQALCFLMVADQHIDIGNVELRNCLDLLGVHPIVFRDTLRILKKRYHLPKNMDLLAFIRYIGPVFLKKNASKEYD